MCICNLVIFFDKAVIKLMMYLIINSSLKSRFKQISSSDSHKHPGTLRQEDHSPILLSVFKARTPFFEVKVFVTGGISDVLSNLLEELIS